MSLGGRRFGLPGWKGAAWLVLSLLVMGCGAATGQAGRPGEASSPTGTLTVYAAASLTDVFTELGRQFEGAQPGVTVLLNFAGSQQLAQQLGQGAPADVFASADERQMQVVVQTGRIDPQAVRAFARNQLVVIYPADNPAGLHSLQDLARPGVHLLLAAPQVPAGAYSQAFLERASQEASFGADYLVRAQANVVSYEENVRAVLTKVALGEADAGLVYTTDLASVKMDVGRLEIPPRLNSPATYPLAPLRDSHAPALAQMFVDLVLGPAGQALLAEHGFVPIAGQ